MAFRSSRVTPAVRQRAGGRNARGQFTSKGAVVEGLDAIVHDFSMSSNAVRPAAGHVVVDQADQAADRMRGYIAVGTTGRSRASISSDDDWTEDGTAVFAEAGPEWFVAAFIENGTAKMAPRPFAEPAVAEQLPIFERAVAGIHDDVWR